MKDTVEALNSYVTDMLALEEHIQKAIGGQIADLAKYPTVKRELETLHATIESHITSLQGLARSKGGKGPADLIKEAGSTVLGLAAGAIDLMRSESLPKNLRDDYAAFSLANIGYVMLHTTALSFGDRNVAEVAHRHLADYARAVMTLNNIIPAAVIQFFKEEGLPVNESALGEINRNIEEVWHQSSGTSSAANLGSTWQK